MFRIYRLVRVVEHFCCSSDLIQYSLIAPLWYYVREYPSKDYDRNEYDKGIGKFFHLRLVSEVRW